MPKPLVVIAALLIPLSALAGEISDFDIATYALTKQDGQLTGMAIRLSRNNGQWVMEGKQKEPNAPWKNITCDTGCKYRPSTTAEKEAYLATFPGEMPRQFEIACIQNMASAFCRLTKKDNPTKGGYAFIGLVTGKPVPMTLQRLAKSSF